MAFIHGKDTYVSVDGDDLSQYTQQSDMTREADEHDVTGYGADDYVFQGGLLKGGFTMSGNYSDDVAGPRAVIEPLIGTNVTVVRRPAGTGAGKPQESFSVHVKKYVESNPYAGQITWTAEFTKSGAITKTTQ
jgi:hypothetical protein